MPINKKTWLLGYPMLDQPRPSAEITLTVNGQNKENGQTFTPSNPIIGTTVQYVVAVRNAGNAVLRLTNASRSGAVDIITAWSDLILGHGETATATITLNTATGGAKSGSFTFNTNDPDGNEKIYTVNVSYTVLEMNIKVTLGVTQVTDGGSYAAGEYGESAVAQVTCTVENIGDALLTIQNPTVDGHVVSASAFSDLTLNPAQSVTSTITLNTATSILTVARSGNIHIASDDPDTPSFDVQINFNANPVWLVDDQFITADSAPVDTPRNCEPTGVLTFVQFDGQHSISSGKLDFPAQASPSWGDQQFINAVARTRAAGLAIIGKVTISSGSIIFPFGWWRVTTALDPNTAANFEHLFYLAGSAEIRIATKLPAFNIVGAYATATEYDVAIILRASGAYTLIKGGAFTNWTLLWVGIGINNTNLYAAYSNFQAAGNLNRFSVRQLANDWLNANPIATQVLAGARSAGDTFTHEANAIIECIITTLSSSSSIRLMFRRTDNTNTWEVAVNSAGTINLNEIVSGSSTSRGSVGGVVSAGHRVVVKADDTTIRVYSGTEGSETLRITYASATNFQTNTNGRLDSLGTGGAVSDIITNPVTVSGNALAELTKGL